MSADAVRTKAEGTNAQPFHAAAGSHAVWWLDSQVEIKLTRSQTDGQLGMWAFQARRGAASPMHVHHREDEQFLLVEGEACFTSANSASTRVPATSCSCPARSPTPT